MQNTNQQTIARDKFLRNCSGEWKIVLELTPDCGHRKYWRVVNGNRTAVLVMDGETLDKFCKISNLLIKSQFSAPKIYEIDGEFALLQDFGKTSLRTLEQEKAITLAIDTAKNFKNIDVKGLPLWNESQIQKGRGEFVQNYLKGDCAQAQSFEDAWMRVENELPRVPQIFVHGDFHPDNLMYLEDGKCGILDFQDAMIGSGAYDVVNLLEDARDDISPELKDKMLNRYCKNMSKEERAAFDAWYRVLGTQFHCRVLGLFTRIGGDYAAHIPRLKNYIRQHIKAPSLRPILTWMRQNNVDELL